VALPDLSPLTKPEARAELRRLLPDAGRQAFQSGRICEQLRIWLADQSPMKIATFAALPGEPDLRPLADELTGHQWFFPRVEGAELVFHLYQGPQSLVTGAYGIAEPVAGTPTIGAGEIDLFLCPGLGFTPQGQRIGKGKGFYDRALAGAAPSARCIGVAFREMLVQRLPSEPHDLLMHGVMTPVGLVGL
jgi:5-formyltetrahydrofolate cyclo-ligase